MNDKALTLQIQLQSTANTHTHTRINQPTLWIRVHLYSCIFQILTTTNENWTDVRISGVRTASPDQIQRTLQQSHNNAVFTLSKGGVLPATSAHATSIANCNGCYKQRSISSVAESSQITNSFTFCCKLQLENSSCQSKNRVL